MIPQKIEIKDATVHQRQFQTNNGTQTETFQTGWMDTGKPYPEELHVQLDKNHQGYPIGDYMLSPDSITVGNFKRLQFKPVLVPFKKQQ